MEKITSPLIYGFCVSDTQSITQLDWEHLESTMWPQDCQWRWLHVDREYAGLKDWLELQEGTTETVVNAMLQIDTRPRVIAHNNGFLLNLRGVNLSPGSMPEDMVSLRLWVTENQVVSTCARRVLAAEDLRDAFLANSAPGTVSGVVSFITDRLVGRIDPVVVKLQEELDEMEEKLLNENEKPNASQLISFRRSVLGLRRYIAPQRDALIELIKHEDSVLIDNDRHQLCDSLDWLIRLAEDLDLIRERAMLQHEQLVAERTDAINDRLFVLALISAVFLPLSIVAGLFGVNIGGMPGANNPYGFIILCAAMALLAVVIVVIFRRMKWI